MVPSCRDVQQSLLVKEAQTPALLNCTVEVPLWNKLRNNNRHNYSVAVVTDAFAVIAMIIIVENPAILSFNKG